MMKKITPTPNLTRRDRLDIYLESLNSTIKHTQILVI